MFSFFKKSTVPKQHPFYGQKVFVYKTEIQSRQHGNHFEVLEINNLDYVTIYNLGDSNGFKNCWVNLKSFSKMYLSICTLADDFDKLEKFLLPLPNFDKELFLEIKNKLQEHPESLVWKKDQKADFEIETNTNHNSGLDKLQKGLTIENENFRIDWSDFYYLEKILKSRIERFPNPSFKSYQYFIKKPTILGGLKVNEIIIETDSFEANKVKMNLPFEKIRTCFKLGFDRKKEVLKIKSHLDLYFNQEAKSEEDLNFSWEKDKIKVDLYCFYRREIDDFDAVAWLKINYSPDVSSFYETNYFKNFSLGNHINYAFFDFKIDLNSNYREVDIASYTPTPLSSLMPKKAETIIWKDSQNGIIGIGNKEHSVLFTFSELDSFMLSIQNHRGSEGSNCLIASMKNQKAASFYIGSVSSTKICIENFKKITEVTQIEINELHYDEHY